MWDSRVLEYLDLKVASYSLSFRFKKSEDDFIWVFIGIYGPLSQKVRKETLEELGSIRGLWEEPWCLVKGFNMICHQV